MRVAQRPVRERVEQHCDGIANHRPLLEGGTSDERDAEALRREAREADDQERAEDERVFGLGLDADAVRALDVPPPERPEDPDHEDHAEHVGGGGVALVDAPVEELRRVRQLVVDLEDDGRHEEDEETEVDHRMHDARRRVAQQGLHPHAGAEAFEPPLYVRPGRAAVVGLAPLVVLDPQ